MFLKYKIVIDWCAGCLLGPAGGDSQRPLGLVEAWVGGGLTMMAPPHPNPNRTNWGWLYGQTKHQVIWLHSVFFWFWLST